MDDFVTPQAVDRFVGSQLRAKRTLLGFSQTALASRLDVSFQQVQKYERGANQMSAFRLYETSLIFDEPVEFFFAGLPGQQRVNDVGTPGEASPPSMADELTTDCSTRETLEMVKVFHAIQSPAIRKQVRELIRLVAAIE
jgi:transcriptional regulator with XRE-family HTH domain